MHSSKRIHLKEIGENYERKKEISKIKCMTHFILFSYTIKNILTCLNLEHQVRSTLFLLRNTNFRKTKWAQRPLFLLLRRFNVTTPPTKLTSQPPTSQVAKQICYCLSAQYESHASSWLDGKLHTKRDRVSLVRIFCFNSTTISFRHFFFSFLDLSGLPACAEIALLLRSMCYLPGSECGAGLCQSLCTTSKFQAHLSLLFRLQRGC